MKAISLPVQRSGRSRSTYHVVGKRGIGLTTTTHTIKRVEHAGAEEANEGHHGQLELGRRIVDTESRVQDLVLPSAGEEVHEGEVVVALSHSGGVMDRCSCLKRRSACLFSLFRHLELKPCLGWMQVLKGEDAIYPVRLR